MSVVISRSLPDVQTRSYASTVAGTRCPRVLASVARRRASRSSPCFCSRWRRNRLPLPTRLLLPRTRTPVQSARILWRCSDPRSAPPEDHQLLQACLLGVGVFSGVLEAHQSLWLRRSCKEALMPPFEPPSVSY